MTEPFLTFQKFNDIGLANEIAERLKSFNIDYLLEDNQKFFDPTFANNNFDADVCIKIRPEDFAKLENGLELEDGFIKPDSVEFVGEGKREIGIEIHSGKNRIVRRIFEHLGYEVEKLDRVTYAGLTKKDLGRGKWRFLTAKEIGFLKMIG